MIPVDPVDLTDFAPFDPFSYYIHIVIGIIALLAAVTALSAQKGSPLHILAGRIFIACTIIVCGTSLVLLSVRMAPPLLVAALTSIYAIATALLALKPSSPNIRKFEIGFFIFEIAVVGMFLSMAIPNILVGNIVFIGPLVITIIPLILLAGDINFFRKQDIRSKLRIRRHLSRMIWAFIISVRAPLAEIYPHLNIPVLFILLGPLVIGPIMVFLFLRQYPVKTSG